MDPTYVFTKFTSIDVSGPASYQQQNDLNFFGYIICA